jgi:hypothetical protein
MADENVNDFFRGVSKDFNITMQENSVEQDITSDTVVLYIKTRRGDADGSAILTKNADVTTQGASGIAVFALTSSDTDISTGVYYMDITWNRTGGKEYVAHDQIIKVKERVSDP